VQPQLQVIADELHFATARLHALASVTPDEQWSTRAHPERWSVGECIAHLNLTSQAYVPLLTDGVARAKAAGPRVPSRRYRRDLLGWFLWKMLPPPVRFRVRTPAQFIPQGTAPKGATIAEFERLQLLLLDLLTEADGRPMKEIKVASPFRATTTYDLYSCFSVLAPHEHRHLWQAERAGGS
jgi:hypothetical protein